MNDYVMNMETHKLEFHFEKEDYLALPEDLKKEINNNFLFSGKSNTWVSRAKFPNLRRAEEVAKKLGLTDGGKTGERLSFEEQMEREAKRAQERSERCELKSDQAAERDKALEKPVEDMGRDPSFFTQPLINSSAGRAFPNERNRMFAAWDKGLEEFKKSEYYARKAETARQTAQGTMPTDKASLDRKIKETERIIRAQRKYLENYQNKLEQIVGGEVSKSYGGGVLTAETVQGLIEDMELLIESGISKFIYYQECLEAAGGVEFSRKNIKTGYLVELSQWGKCKVIGTGRVNLTYRILEGGAAGMAGQAAYAEINRILSDQIRIDPHPFQVGEAYTVKVWNGQAYADKEYRVTKITEEKVTLKSGTERAITRRPRKLWNGSGPNGCVWALGIIDGLTGTVYKNDEETK
ncbi:MAG: DUF3560 domain-containing protein [Lachnospiraceae bacterium]|nr:DUF3560 domain-containing protein [Lachnospiraceae bacterium]